MESQVEERLKEFQQGIEKYMHLLKGGMVDRDKSLNVERIELELVQELRQSNKCMGDLQKTLDELQSSNWIVEAFIKASSSMGVEASMDIDVEKALRDFFTGNIDSEESMVMAIIVQSIARCIAEESLEMNGIIDATTPYCPICGAESRTMVVRDDGYDMICPFCSYEWRVSRENPVCPYCGNSNPVSIGIFTDKARRIGLLVCQECGETWRAILDRGIKAPRILLPVISMGAEAFRKFIRDDMSG